MAKTTITQISDDLDGSKDAEEVSFSFRGVEYSIDLGKKNQAAFEKALKPYLGAATKVSKRPSRSGSGRSAATPKKRARDAGKQSGSGQDLAAVREWARSKGIEVSERGRVARSVLEQYSTENS